MGWFEYYKLLEKYHGEVKLATTDELQEAWASNPNNPIDALRIAQQKWREKLIADQKTK